LRQNNSTGILRCVSASCIQFKQFKHAFWYSLNPLTVTAPIVGRLVLFLSPFYSPYFSSDHKLGIIQTITNSNSSCENRFEIGCCFTMKMVL